MTFPSSSPSCPATQSGLPQLRSEPGKPARSRIATTTCFADGPVRSLFPRPTSTGRTGADEPGREHDSANHQHDDAQPLAGAVELLLQRRRFRIGSGKAKSAIPIIPTMAVMTFGADSSLPSLALTGFRSIAHNLYCSVPDRGQSHIN